MPIQMSVDAIEESTYAVKASFYDEDDTAVTPNSVTWTLTNNDGVVMNGRQAVVAAAASTVTIVLSGDDLALETEEVNLGRRILTISAVYDSTLGSNLPFNESAYFNVVNLKAIT